MPAAASITVVWIRDRHIGSARVTRLKSIVLASIIGVASSAPAFGQAPPAPNPVAPASGASLAQPLTLSWSAVSDPRGPVASYSWQVGTTSSFTVIPAAGFTDERNGTPIPTSARVSGLPNGTVLLESEGDRQRRRHDRVRRFGMVGLAQLHDHRTRSRAGHAELHRAGERIGLSRRANSSTSNGPQSRARSTTCSKETTTRISRRRRR